MKMKAPIAFLTLCLTGMAACGLLGGGEDAPLSGEHTQPLPYEQANLVFAKAGKIYLMDTVTGQTRFWAEGGFPRWSPDGQRIAFTGLHKELEAYQIFIMDVDSTDKRLVTLWKNNGALVPNPNTSSSPVWAPDGLTIAFESCLNCEVGGFNYEVFTMALDASEGLRQRRVTKNLYNDHVADWSPDGSKLLIQSEVRPDGSKGDFSDVYIMSPDGSGKQEVILADSNSTIYYPRFSPDGEKVVFILGTNETNELFTIKVDGTNMKQITQNDQIERSVTWHPSDDKLILVMGLEGNYHFRERLDHIYVMDLDKDSLRQLTEEPGQYEDPHWRPSWLVSEQQ